MQPIRAHKIVKICRTETGLKKLQVEQFDLKKEQLETDLSEEVFDRLRSQIDARRDEISVSSEPDYIEIAIVPPSPDYLVRHSMNLRPLVTIDTNIKYAYQIDEYRKLFYENFDIISDVVCLCVRDPSNLDYHLLVSDDKKPLKNQIKISDWNVPIDFNLIIATTGYYFPLETPICAAFWIACHMMGFVNIIPTRGKKAEPDVMDENIDAFPEGDSSELAEGSEDSLLEGAPELPQ